MVQNQKWKQKEQLRTQKAGRKAYAEIGHLTVQVDWLKKNLKKCSDLTGRKSLVMKNDRLTIKEQCELLEVNRTSMYYQPVEPAEKAWSVKNTSNHVLTTGTQNSATLVIGKSKKSLYRKTGLQSAESLSDVI